MIYFQNVLWHFIKTHPDFKNPTKRLTLDEERKRCVNQINALESNAIYVRFAKLNN
jgi:hypothetical protein